MKRSRTLVLSALLCGALGGTALAQSSGKPGAQPTPPPPAAVAPKPNGATAPPAAAAGDQQQEKGGNETSFIADDRDISGAEEFIRYCSVCHGLDAKGSGALAKSLKKPPADLTQIKKRNKGYFPFSTIARMIRDGGSIEAHGNKDMPAWGEVFRDHVDPIMSRALIFELTLYLEEIQE